MGLRDAWKWLKLGRRLAGATKAIREAGMTKKTAWKSLRSFLVGVGSVALFGALSAVGGALTDPEAVRAMLTDLPPSVQAALVLLLASIGEYIRGAVKHRGKS